MGAINTGGLDYENKVKTAIRKVERQIPDFYLMRGASGGNDRQAADVILSVKRKPVGIEVKKTRTAQMGGEAYFQYSTRNGKFSFIDNKGKDQIDVPTQEMINDALNAKSQDVNRFLDYIRNFAPTEYHRQTAQGLPLTCTKEAWDSARDKGFLQRMNSYIGFNVDFIAKHYAVKGTNYIQIGGAGLFYLKDNPLDLPVPKLTGDIDIEVRVAHHGGRPIRGGLNITVVDGTVRAQARLKTKNVSPFTLDNPEHVMALFKR